VKPAPLRVWIERDYDGGRWGAWLLDVPGAFGWATSRALAVSQSPSTLGWFRDWLGRHGEPWPLPPVERVEEVEEVAATVVGGYERNATFGQDARAVTGDEVEAAIRRLGYARQDLLAIAAQVRDRERRSGPLPTDAGERTADEVLRHVAGAEAWLGSRLDPDARFEGPPREGDALAYLDATRAWAMENLRRLHASDPAASRTDSKGESWTLAKVVRRYLYHSIDHLRELDRRLGRAERRDERLAIRRDRLTDVEPLVRLLHSVGWDRRALDEPRLERAIAASHAMIGAWDGDELVGFTRELGDGEMNAYLSMIVVDPRWQGYGIADRLVRAVMEGRSDVRFTLAAADGVDEYYRRFGFEPDRHAMVRRRRD
jgi:ribosomal protein S18 acetylase RimI-like enzyme